MEQTELLFPEYLREDLIAKPACSFRRVRTKAGRYYATTFDGEETTNLYPSITTIIRETTPISPFIIDKMISMGKEKWDEYLYERSEYGTVMHILISELIKRKQLTIPFQQEEVVDIALSNKGFNHNIFDRFKDDVYSDLLAFAMFYYEYKVAPIAIELPLASRKHRFAGTLDMVCVMTVPTKGYWGEVYKTGPQKGNLKETIQDVDYLAFVDFKSGRHGFYRTNELQLKMCQLLFMENYPDLITELGMPIKLYNWAPKEWRSEPSYLLTDQTGKVSTDNVTLRAALMNDEKSPTLYQEKVYSGTLVLGEEPVGLIKYEDVF